MTLLTLLLVGLFLPLFPMSMVFNRLFARVRQPLPRAAMLVAWPHVGLVLLSFTQVQLPTWVVAWALATSGLYALRALAVREVGIWTGFMATSAWALLWVPVLAEYAQFSPRYDALGFSLPLVLLALLASELEDRFGAAYTDLYGGLGSIMPRFSGVLVVVIFAVIATPLFPGFFTLLGAIVMVSPGIGVTLCGIWLLWSWTGARLLQGLIVGPPGSDPVQDITLTTTWAYSITLVALVIAGLWLSGGLL